ncbi:MAG: glycosyl transferase family 28 [Chitinophagaceae bacterium]|nr:MAG: glycosyl transferase family 28 [Chitinophagaceae bacterium]
MNQRKFNMLGAKSRILVAPLDWGLGHATRCIPIIQHLQSLDCEVFIAAEGPIKALLQSSFPKIQFLELGGYHIHLSRSRSGFSFQIIRQLPKIIATIYHERRWLKAAIRKYEFDAVISDNRPGLYHRNIPCIYITHQLFIKTNNWITAWLAQKIHYHFINKFDRCWVPDMAGELNLAGALSHPKKLPRVPVQYIGPLSRFQKSDQQKKYALAILLSGPEPQRTILEEIIKTQLKNYSDPVLLIRGLPGNKETIVGFNPNVEIENHLNAAELNKALLAAELVICRSGYSTVMDLVLLQQKAILIPTTAQTEQEYLADILKEKNIFYSCSQEDFNLQEALRLAASFPFLSFETNNELYKTAVDESINNLV